jgi:hypothetical protein
MSKIKKRSDTNSTLTYICLLIINKYFDNGAQIDREKVSN